VFGEARGESVKGQLAVAYTIVNRVSHRGYPSTVHAVAYQTYGRNHQYNTLDCSTHNSSWENAKSQVTREYNNSIKAASDALCQQETDPTTCATDYCAFDPCSSTNSNIYWIATQKQQIGHHYFVCREKANGKKRIINQ